MNKKLKINKNKPIGQVIYIVEGDVTEPELLKHIFVKLLNYSVISYNKKNDNFTPITFQGSDKYSKVFIVPSKYSALVRLKPSDYLDNIYTNLRNTYGLDPENSATFFLFDRDRKSNKRTVVEHLLSKLASSRGNDNADDYEMNGLLLLSYPCVEAMLLQANSDPKPLINGTQAKQYITNQNYRIESLNESNLLGAANNMLNVIESIKNKKFDISTLDNFKNTNLQIFYKEEKYWEQNKIYITLSLITLSLLDLQILEQF